jgi:AAA15 family ATPase/GTPase
MLDSLHIQNYRLFKDLKIDKLGQVNLIAGKNNTGKTALLEALRIWASEGDKFILTDILESRGDYVFGHINESNTLFSKRDFKYFIEIASKNFALGIQAVLHDDNQIDKLAIHKNHHVFFITDFPDTNRMIDVSGLIYVPLIAHLDFLSKYWEKVSLTPLEEDIKKILKIIDPKLQALRVDNGKARIKTIDFESPIPLKNLGDGANRLLLIALALVNAKNKILLLDEFEVGLHHSVQEQLWDIIFKYAKEWNIQVFATTHSQDTVEKFYYVANKPQNAEIGKYFTLNKNGEDIVAVDYDMEEIKLALESNIEIR